MLLFLFQSSGDPVGGLFAGLLCCGGPIAAIILLFWVINDTTKKKIAAARNAYSAYQEALQGLKSDPANPNLKQTALHLGRVYSEMSRSLNGQGGVTIYDEIALMNDINAASAGATSPYQHSWPNSNTTVEERLAKLADLRTRGLIDENEYNSRRQKILDEI